MTRVVVASNRVPSCNDKSAPAGGLAVGLRAALEDSGGLWLGWDGEVAEQPSQRVTVRQSHPFVLATLRLCQRELDGYYAGFANRVLWPLLHDRIDLMHYDPADFASYQDVNRKFAECLSESLQPQDLIWVHDYHLMPLGRRLRENGVRQPLGHFLHVPFPEPEQWAALPCHRELITGLLAYDLVGFQTRRDQHNFHDYVARHLGGSVSADGVVSAVGRNVRSGVFPIGIDAEEFAAVAGSARVQEYCARLRRHFGNSRAIIGVDRLDYSKALPERLQAFERLLCGWPQYSERVALLQVAAPSRETIPEYRALADAVARQAGALNARHGTLDWSPLCYLHRSFDQTRLAALYRFARVGLVTPLRDGMNLVAKEYVAAQNAADPGVLVLSRFAGAACQLDGALLVNPHDVGEVAQALHRALEMPRNERAARWTALWNRVRRDDIHAWRRQFLDALQQAGAARLPIGWQRAPVVPVRSARSVQPGTSAVARTRATNGGVLPMRNTPGGTFRH